jgi:nucleotide-binding universal stress UspA family protein
MKPFQKILVPFDFSAHAQEALDCAVDLARRYQASLTLAHVHETPAYPVPEGFLLYAPEAIPSLLTELRQLLERARQQAAQAGGRPVQARLLEGIVAVELIRLVCDDSFDLVVMGSHGRTGFAHLVLGSVAEKVARRAPCSVLTVKLAERTPGSP